MRAARALAGLEQRQVAERAGINPTTLLRMEGSDDKPVSGYAATVEKVVNVLRDAGVVITDSGVDFVGKGRTPRN